MGTPLRLRPTVLTPTAAGNPGGSPEATRRAFNKRFLLDLAEDWQQQTSVASPKTLESVGCHVGVPNGVLDVLVPEVVLQSPRVVAVVGELEPTGMAKHVRLDREFALDEADHGRDARSGHAFGRNRSAARSRAR